MAKQDKLSERQESIMSYIAQSLQKNSRPPTIREIVEATDITSTSVVSYNLGKLEEKGYVARTKDVSRGIQLTEKAQQAYATLRTTIASMIRIPLMGDIVASEPVQLGHDDFATYDEEDAVEVSTSLLPDKNVDSLFALRVRGNSMIDAMVSDRDIVIMKQAKEARNGDMVAVWLPQSGEMTLKYFFSEGDRVRLQPANPTMEPIYVHAANVEIQGKVMMVVRQTA
jgi:repressor LexA